MDESHPIIAQVPPTGATLRHIINAMITLYTKKNAAKHASAHALLEEHHKIAQNIFEALAQRDVVAVWNGIPVDLEDILVDTGSKNNLCFINA